MESVRIAVIMAGGVGERFWPLSRRHRPKQLLNLTSPTSSLLAESVARITPLIPAENVFVVTGRHLQPVIREAEVGIPAENVVAEPCKRNTAGCLVYAAAVALARYPVDADRISMAVVTADHLIADRNKFLGTVSAALQAAESQDALVTIGIQPTRPETGYGYIEIPEQAQPAPGGSADFPVYPVRRFCEKPDASTARRFVETGRFLWNSGMFFWRISSFVAEFEQVNPEIAAAARGIRAALESGDQAGAERVFETLPDISIDYALMEQARRVLVAPGAFPWDDVGAWDALDRTFPRDARGNVAVGDPVLIDSRNCIVYNDPGAERTAVAVVGASDMVVVVTEDGVVVAPKARAQEVRAAVTQLRERGAAQL